MTAQTHPIDGIPHLRRGRLPKGFAHVGKDGVDACIGVIDQNIQFAILLSLDTLKELLHFGIIPMIHDHRLGLSATGFNFRATCLQVTLTTTRDVDKSPGLTQLKSDAPTNPARGTRHKTDGTFQIGTHAGLDMVREICDSWTLQTEVWLRLLLLIIVHIGSQSEVLRDCSGDGFESVDYLIDPSDAESPKAFLAVKIDAKSSRSVIHFSRALAHCQTLGSEVWQVLDGQPEWQAVMDHALKKNQHSVWIHAIPIEPYSTSGDQDQLKARAQEGRGLPIRWPQTREPADYSRFIGGDESEKCVTVKKNEPHLWELTPCDNRYFVACVKRHCQEPK
ncbi:hypothetical protein TCAL_17025 [Tigriopus californicus]|uniref:Uncharacterized protein n=1 Tax=Tigriopus californicus TaxID=6832 RepID=A0A553PFT1_TIGCA|nr:hypothetical protein TCAL_17025 [Tigriopus californicus]